jgi:hypothetical protein
VVDVADTGLPMGESDTIVMPGGELRAYLHASTLSAGIRDPYGQPVPFPGCVVLYTSRDDGRTFEMVRPTCLFACRRAPCSSLGDHIDQQQYPRVAHDGRTFFLVYEYRGRVRLRRSTDGLAWSEPEPVTGTGLWQRKARACPPAERIGPHPFVPPTYTCLNGGPPGIFVEQGRVYVFVGLGQNPGHIGCYTGAVTSPAADYRPCEHNPLISGAPSYGPEDAEGADANAHFDFRTLSSAEVVRVGRRLYMFYEGVRGPGPGDAGDTQFGLGLARTAGTATPGAARHQVDGSWETYGGNPLLVDLPGNVGLGHADVLILNGTTYLYTSLDGETRSRLKLVWQR